MYAYVYKHMILLLKVLVTGDEIFAKFAVILDIFLKREVESVRIKFIICVTA